MNHRFWENLAVLLHPAARRRVALVQQLLPFTISLSFSLHHHL
jgi:hypothetical protein